MESELPVAQKQDLTLYPWGEEILVQKVMFEKVERGGRPCISEGEQNKGSQTQASGVFLTAA